MRTNAPTRLQSPNDNSHPCARDLDLAWQVLGTVARGPLPIKKKRIKKKRIGLSRAPGPYWIVNTLTQSLSSGYSIVNVCKGGQQQYSCTRKLLS
jgi:hypothetical protein